MLTGFLNRGPAIGPAEIAEFEECRQVRLPEDYRRFLLEQNGGRRASPGSPEEQVETDGHPREHQFFSLGAAGMPVTQELLDFAAEEPEAWPELNYDLEVWLVRCREIGYPPELLPIALVYHGDLLLVRLAGKEAGSVYHAWDPDGYDEGHCSRIAASFDELLRDFDAWECA